MCRIIQGRDPERITVRPKTQPFHAIARLTRIGFLRPHPFFMTMSRLRLLPALFCALLRFTSSVARTQQTIPIRQIGPIEARSVDTVTSMFGVRELSDGRIIANDAGSRRLLLFDAALKAFKVIADTALGTKTPYGTRETGIVAYHGDSTLLVDVYTRGFIVVAPNGTMGRVIAAPRTSDVAWLANSRYGFAAIDPKGRLIYRA